VVNVHVLQIKDDRGRKVASLLQNSDVSYCLHTLAMSLSVSVFRVNHHHQVKDCFM